MSAMSAAAAVPVVRVRTVKGTEIEVPEQEIISFVQPLLGFERLKRFLIYQTQAGPVWWMQSVEDAAVAFCVLQPFAAGFDPDMEIGGEDVADIGAAGSDEVEVYTLVVLDQDPAQIRTNLRAPILVGRRSRLAKQVVLADQQLPVRAFLKDLRVKRKT